MSKIIFIGGIHGVGKSTLCKRVSQNLGLETYSSGEIIKRGEDLTNKDVYRIESNQNILLEGLKIILRQRDTILLDGHFVLITSDGKISKISLNTFRDISPVAIIMLEDEPSRIADRLFRRDMKQYSPSILSHLQDEEITYSDEVSKVLKIPYLKVHIQQDAKDIDSTLSKFILTNI